MSTLKQRARVAKHARTNVVRKRLAAADQLALIAADAVAKARASAYAEGLHNGRAEGMAEGRDVAAAVIEKRELVAHQEGQRDLLHNIAAQIEVAKSGRPLGIVTKAALDRALERVVPAMILRTRDTHNVLAREQWRDALLDSARLFVKDVQAAIAAGVVTADDVAKAMQPPTVKTEKIYRVLKRDERGQIVRIEVN